MFATKSVYAPLAHHPRLDQQELSEASATEEAAESSLDTEAIKTVLLESFDAAGIPFEEQTALLASMLPDGAPADVPGLDKEESLNAASEALTTEELEAKLIASLAAAGVPAAEIPAMLARLGPESAAAAQAETTAEESLNAASEALTSEELEARLVASLTAAGVPAAEIPAMLASLGPDSNAAVQAETNVDKSLNATPDTSEGPKY